MSSPNVLCISANDLVPAHFYNIKKDISFTVDERDNGTTFSISRGKLFPNPQSTVLLTVLGRRGSFALQGDLSEV
jgi:hypothetical protein